MKTFSVAEIFTLGETTMTYQEILEAITAHRANSISAAEPKSVIEMTAQVSRKVDEIEWALQALAEKLRDTEQGF